MLQEEERIKQAVILVRSSTRAEGMTSGRRKQKGITQNGKRVYSGNGEGYKNH